MTFEQFWKKHFYLTPHPPAVVSMEYAEHLARLAWDTASKPKRRIEIGHYVRDNKIGRWIWKVIRTEDETSSSS